MDVSKHPVNDRGYTVIPCIALTAENMSDDLVGFQVTIGLKEAGQITSSGIIMGFTDEHLKIQIGGKTKKLPYDPENICLSVYQFSKRILFSNEVVTRSKSQKPPEETSPSPEGGSEGKTEKASEKPSPAPSKLKTQRKPKQEKSKPKASGYVPKHGIVFG